MSDKNIESSSTGNDSDQDFDPTVDMLDGKDFDDEHTLEEEEALEENNSNELNDLQRESEMPIEELLALYRSNMTDNVTSTIDNEEVEDEENSNNETIDECSKTIENVAQKTTISESTTSQLDNDDKLENQSLKFNDKIEPLPVSRNLSRLISTSEDALFEISEDEGDDEDDTPEDSWRRAIQIGDDYQATIPNTTYKHNENLMETVNSLENCLELWNPKQLDEKQVEEYLKNYLINNEQQVNLISNSTDLNDSFNEMSEPTDSQLTKSSVNSKSSNNEISSSNQFDSLIQRDDELALYVLLKNNFRIEDALKCKNNLDKEIIDLFTFIKPWSEDECLLFEDGLRVHGKDFHQIQKNKLPHKIVNELVNFYYLWKKTERHDMFTSKFKFEKRKYSLNPMSTDLMDHFLDDQPQQQSNQTSFNSTTSSLSNSVSITNVVKHSSLTLLPLSNHLSKTEVSTGLIISSNNLDSIEDNSNLSSQSSGLVINDGVNSNDGEPQKNVLSSTTVPIKATTNLNNDLEQSTLNDSSSNLTITTNNSEL